MLQFLTAFLITLISLRGNVIPAQIKNEILARFNQNYHLEETLLPNDLPNEFTPQNLNPTPKIDINELPDINNESELSKSDKKDDNSNKIITYNQKSEKVIGEVAAKAVEHSEPLISCTEYSNLCDQPTTTPTPTPTPIPQIEDKPEPTIIIDPPISPIPLPSRKPCGCEFRAGMNECILEYYCAELY